MKPNGAQQNVQGVGMFRLPGGWWLELGLEAGDDLFPFVRMGNGSSIGGLWVPAPVFVAFGATTKGFVDLVDSGIFVVHEQPPDSGPPILDAGGAPLRPRLAP